LSRMTTGTQRSLYGIAIARDGRLGLAVEWEGTLLRSTDAGVNWQPVSDTTIQKPERTGRIARERDGQWDITETSARLLETADPQRSSLAGSAAAEGTPFARLKVAQLALKVEAQRLALDESKGRLLDVATANATIDEIASTMRDALLNWPARATAAIPCCPGNFCVALKATASPQACRRSKPWL
jgi:hypothetical protein